MYSYILEDYTGRTYLNRERPVVFNLELDPKWVDIGLKPTMCVITLGPGLVFLSGGIFTRFVYEYGGKDDD